MRQALADARLEPADVDAIVAHGTSTPKGDSAEIRAINQVYAGARVAVTSIKGNLGHPSGAAGAQAVVAALCALRDRKLPHTAGTSRVDPRPGSRWSRRPRPSSGPGTSRSTRSASAARTPPWSWAPPERRPSPERAAATAAGACAWCGPR